MNNNILNKETYEQLNKSCQDVKFEDIKLDVEEQIESYVESLETRKSEERESLLEEHVKATVEPELLKWKRKYSGNDSLLKQIRNQINNLKTFENNNKVDISNLKNSIENEKVELDLKKEQIEQAEQNIVSSKKIDLKYEWKKAFVFIVFSIVVAFATYIYFLDNQINLKWAIKTPNERAKAIEKLITAYHDEGYINYIARTQNECFTKYRDEDGKLNKKKLLKDIENVDLSCIEPNLLVDAPAPSINSIFTINKKLLFLAFSAFLLMMLGKVIAIVYERIGYKNWFFYTFSGLSLVVLLSTVYINSTLSSLHIEKSQIEKSMASLSTKLTKIQKDYEDSINYDEEEPEKWKTFPETVKTNKEINKKRAELPKMEKRISDYSFWVSLMVMLAELVIGAVAWMTYSDYIRKKKEVEVSGEGYVDRLKKEFESIKEKIKEYKEEIIQKEKDIEKAQELIGSLTTLLGSIHSNANIEQIAQSYENAIIAKAKAMLQAAETRWHKGGRK